MKVNEFSSGIKGYDRNEKGVENVVIGAYAAANLKQNCTRCTFIGPHVPSPDEGVWEGLIRIGSGDTYLQLHEGKAEIIGASSNDEAVRAMLEGLHHAAELVNQIIRSQTGADQ